MKHRSVIAALAIIIAMPASGGPICTVEDIFAPQDKHVHGSSIVQCPNGDLLTCWFYGSGERTADDVLIQGARLRKGQTEWSGVFLMADSPGFPDCNPVLFRDAKDRLWLFWIAVHANRWECSVTKYRRADNYQADGPPQWSWQGTIELKPGDAFADTLKAKFDELDIDEGIWGEYALPYTRLLVEAAADKRKRQFGWMTRIHPLVLPTGRILLPLYSDGFNVSLAAISDDLGETWRASLPIVGLGPIQPTLVRRNSGEILAYMRDGGDAPNRVLLSRSTDDGETWSAATDTDIPNPSSSLEVIALQDGHWFMVCNDTEDGRHLLTAFLSDDEGHTWKWSRPLESSKDRSESYAYPSVIQSQDGLLHMTYSYKGQNGATIRHRTINTEWIKAPERPVRGVARREAP